ncbi:MAG: M56 family metallopeptidase, partial [Gemmatimonadota bacterium]|nr:M56 family metallopeptidase [Gemmatimonadota bacterium]
MAHVKRFDALTQLGSQIALAVFWFDPLVWLAVRRMRVEREHACDDYVLRDGTAPSLYAGELLEMVRSLGAPRHEETAPAFAALAMARPAEIEGRMLAILNPAADRGPLHNTGTFMTAAIVGLLALPLAALQPFESRAPITGVSVEAPVVRSPVAPQQGEIETVSGLAPTCDAASLGSKPGSSSHSIHADDDTKVLTYRSVTAGRCAQASLVGDIGFSDDERSIVRLAAGAHAFFRERLVGSDRSVEVRRGPGGGPVYTARAGGREVAFDAAMQRWLAGFMPEILREGAINVPARVARLRATGGTQAVLAEIERIRSSGAKRAHYQELVKSPSLPSREMGAAVRHAAREITSSGDLRNVLQNVPRNARSGSEMHAGLAEGIREISSSGDKAAVLASYGDTDDPQMLLLVLTEARGITSDGDKARLLAQLAPRAVGHRSPAVCDAFFQTAETIQSDGDLARTLALVTTLGRVSNDISLSVIRATQHIQSDGDKSRVLINVATRGWANNAEVRQAYVAAARTIRSDGDYRRTMEVLTTREGNL